MADASLKECPSCGAPLPVGPDVTSVKCEYCGTTVQVERKKTPRAPDPMRAPTVYVPRGLPKAAVWALVATGILPFGASVVALAGGTILGAVSSATISFPANCGMNEELKIVGKTFSGTGTLVNAGMNCKIRIENSRLTGDVIVDGSLNDEITIVDSTLEANDVAVRLRQNGTLHASGKTTIHGKENALAGGLNTKAVLEDVELRGDSAAITGDLNTEIHASRTKITGKDAAIAFSTNGHFFGVGATLRADVDGVDAEGNLELSLEGSTIDVGEIGVKGDGNVKAKVTKKSSVTGKASAFDAGDNLDLTIDDSIVESGDTGVVAKWNPHLKIARGGKLRGARVALDGGENLELTLSKGSVESDGTALCGKHNARVEGRDGAITAPVAMHFERPPEERLVGTTVTGSRTYDTRGCGARPESAPATPVQHPVPAAPVAARPPTPTLQVATPTGPAFDAAAAVIALDAATRAASAQCRSSSGKPEQVWVAPGFDANGVNSAAAATGPFHGTPEAACIERVFRGVRIPPFDPKTRPSGLMRAVPIK